MITVQLNRADFEYDIHSLVKAFFPSEEVSVRVGKQETQEEISFHIVTNYLEDSIEIILECQKTASLGNADRYPAHKDSHGVFRRGKRRSVYQKFYEEILFCIG